MCTALAPVIGYDQAAKIAKLAYERGRTVREVAIETSGLTRERLEELLDPEKQTHHG
jgi:fumarate hydratase class II